MPETDRMPALLTGYHADRGALERRYSAPDSLRRTARLTEFVKEWQKTADEISSADLSPSDAADHVLFRRHLRAEADALAEEERLRADIAPLIDFADDLIALDEARRDHRDVDPSRVARTLERAVTQIRAIEKDKPPTTTVQCYRAAGVALRLRDTMRRWFEFRDGFDPLFSWWVAKPYQALDVALEAYATRLKTEFSGIAPADADEAIVGEPIGRDALTAALGDALIDATPEELTTIGRAEMAWCRAEMVRAAREMGLGDDWRAALERIKEDHVAPGEQPGLVRDLAGEAIAYVREHDLVTVPLLAEETWRMEMMSAERQKVSPFFLGGEAIIVSFPTVDMDEERKRMSQRGNNRHFARATVQHELIPGHHLQMYLQQRYRPYRRLFYTPFWVEGWTLHWEMLLWERGWARTPEERIGMLFWRMHRGARVVFSLAFHLGQMTPDACVEMLVGEVGHERDNAVAEVRRSFGGDYDPLYQAAYLLGGLQVHALYREMVERGPMTAREFHDATLQQNYLPIAVLRAVLRGEPVSDDHPGWRFDTPEHHLRLATESLEGETE